MLRYTAIAVSPFCIRVYLDNRSVGEIRQAKHATGYFYKPMPRGKAGETFKTIAEVKKSLEN